eukprot:216593_1
MKTWTLNSMHSLDLIEDIWSHCNTSNLCLNFSIPHYHFKTIGFYDKFTLNNHWFEYIQNCKGDKKIFDTMEVKLNLFAFNQELIESFVEKKIRLSNVAMIQKRAEKLANDVVNHCHKWFKPLMMITKYHLKRIGLNSIEVIIKSMYQIDYDKYECEYHSDSTEYDESENDESVDDEIENEKDTFEDIMENATTAWKEIAYPLFQQLFYQKLSVNAECNTIMTHEEFYMHCKIFDQ